MLANAKICRKIAPPMQLKPKPWNARYILRLKVELDLISIQEQFAFLRLMLYEFLIIISANLK